MSEKPFLPPPLSTITKRTAFVKKIDEAHRHLGAVRFALGIGLGANAFTRDQLPPTYISWHR